MAQVSLDGLWRLQSAAGDFARPEMVRIADAVVVSLKDSPAIGFFGDVAARHMWDEYCWALQERPFSDNWNSTIRAFVSDEVEKLPKYALIFLSDHAFEMSNDIDWSASLGSIWVDGIVDAVLEEIIGRASQRNLYLIGPHRADVIGGEIGAGGTVWAALSDRGEATNLIAGHVDTMINADADLVGVAATLADVFLRAAKDEVEGQMLADFFERFADDMRRLLIEKDILPTLHDIRSQLIARLDGN